jgi:heptosyltransferase-1
VEFSSIESVLVIKPSSLGDVVHTLPAVALMRRQYPGLQIGWVVSTACAPLLEGNELIEGVGEVPRERFRGFSGVCGILWWMRGLRGLKPDLALDFQGLLRSALMGRYSRAGELVGLSDGREGSRCFYDCTVPVPAEGGHAVDRYLALVEACGVKVPVERGDLEFPLPAGEEPVVDGGLPERYVLFHPVSRGLGKSFPGDEVAQFCKAMGKERVVLVGQVDEETRGAWELPGNATDLMNETTIGELIWLMRRAAYVVTVDSGPMHLAAAVSERVLGIHTWTDPRKVGPYRGGCLVWKSGAVRRVETLGREDASLDEARGDKRWTLSGGDVETIAAAVRAEMGPS